MENYTEFKKVVELWQADKQQYVRSQLLRHTRY